MFRVSLYGGVGAVIQRCMKTCKVLSFFFSTCQTGKLLFQNPILSSWEWIFFSWDWIWFAWKWIFFSKRAFFLSYFFMTVSIFLSISLSISSSEMHLLLSTIPDNPRKIPTTMRKACIVATHVVRFSTSKSIWIYILYYRRTQVTIAWSLIFLYTEPSKY